MGAALAAMTTARTFSEHEGTLGQALPATRKCGICRQPMTVQLWKSHDGAYEDDKYTCPAGHVEWVDGIDS